jgi:Pro-kumamolisin, activation domain/Subtilase family
MTISLVRRRVVVSLFVALCCGLAASATSLRQNAAKSRSSPVSLFSNNTLTDASNWTADTETGLLNLPFAALLTNSLEPRERLPWNTSAKAPYSTAEFLSWACWHLLKPSMSAPQDEMYAARREACPHLRPGRSYVLHIVHWGRVNDRIALRSSDWYVYKPDGDVLVRDRSEASTNRLFGASQDALFFGIHFFDAVTEDERSRLRLDYSVLAARTIPESFQEHPLTLTMDRGDQANPSQSPASPDVLVIAGIVTGQSSFRLAFSSTLTVAKEAQAYERVALRGHVLSIPAEAKPVARVETKEAAQEGTVWLTVVMRRSNEFEFEAFARDVNDPRTSTFGKFRSQEELTEQFGPSKDNYSKVFSYLKNFDFQFSELPSNRMIINLKGSREMIERAFQVKLQDYSLGERTFFATSNDPSVPASISPYIFAVVGLSTLSEPHPGISEVASPSGLNPMALSTAYDFPSGADGAGETIALLEYDNFNKDDLKFWLKTMETLPEAALSRIDVKTVLKPVGHHTPTGEGEVLLDLEVVMGLTSGANYVVYESDSTIPMLALLNQALIDKVSVISNSWSRCESMLEPATLDSLEILLSSAKSSGVSVFTAAGDYGPVCWPSNKKEVSVPADAPSAMAVGGTSLDIGADNSYLHEAWYPKGGFGLSAHFEAPPYFAGAAGPGLKHRPVPDFAAHADKAKGIRVYQSDKNGWYTAAGTSISAPIWASAIAVLNQRTGHPAGLIVSWLALSGCTKYLHAPKDMTGANNDFQHLGLGSIDLAKLISADATCRPTHP